jgi:ureidoacrylate peracid hydrolase
MTSRRLVSTESSTGTHPVHPVVKLDSAGLAQLVDPGHTAIVVVDVQRTFTDLFPVPVWPPLEETLANIPRFLDQARAASVPIIFMRVIIPPDEHSKNTLDWPEAFRANLAPGSPGIEWDPQVMPRPGETQLVKTRYSSFFRTSLESILRERGVETVVVLGLTTDICVGSTVRDAWQRDFRTVTVSNCTSEVGTGRYEAALVTLEMNFGRVFTSDEIMAAWQPQLAVQAP